MKKTPIIIVIIAVIFCVLGILIYRLIKIDKLTNSITLADNLDEKTFKNEYESLNNELKDDGTKKYVQISIGENNKMKYASFEEITSMLKNGTGIIYFGFPSCPWCRRTLPVFLNTINNYDVKQVLYFNALDLRDKKHLDDDGNIVTDTEGDPKYYELLDLLGDNIGEYQGLNDSSIKRLYFPTYVFIKDGKIIGTQISSVKSYTSTKEDMTDEQKSELNNIFEGYIEKIFTKINCDEKTEGC